MTIGAWFRLALSPFAALFVGGCASRPLFLNELHAPLFDPAELAAVPHEERTVDELDCAGNGPAETDLGCEYTRADGVRVILVRRGYEYVREHEEAHALGMHHGPWWPTPDGACAVVTDPGRTRLTRGEVMCVPFIDSSKADK